MPLVFRLITSIALPELKCTLREWVHEKSQAHVMHIGCEDPENVFCLSLRTLPKSSNGVAHILEHVTLCGSKKFPIKDPFFSMNRRSLNTFMNALTGQDFTCYPAATQVKKDFYNLLDVYIDAVFHPRLRELSFWQEGHRLEFEDPEDPTTPLVIRGIVYNEMKGALTSPQERMHELLYQALFPDLTYGINSGGDPKEIPSLTYQELLDFHNTYYHPSRCLFYFYGNLPAEEHLEFLEKNLLRQVKPLPALPPLPAQPRFPTPRYIKASYPIAAGEPLEGKCWIAVSWLTCPILDQESCLSLSVLELLLLDTDASPLKKALLQSKLCAQVSSSVHDEISEVPFTLQLKGCDAINADTIDALIQETLQTVYQQGFSAETVENALHQLELHRSEINGDYYPFGLTLFMRSGLLKQHGGEAQDGLLLHTLFHRLRHRLSQEPHHLEEELKRYLIDNPHRVRVVLTPDPLLEQQEREEEKVFLENRKNQLTSQEVEAILKNTEALKIFQREQEEEDLEVLPKVTLEDAPPQERHLPLSSEPFPDFTVFHQNCFTNEIGYADLLFDLPYVPQEQLPLLRLLTVVFSQMGFGTQSYEEILTYMQAYTGGVAPYLALHMQADNPNHFFPSFVLRGKALYRNLNKLFPLFKTMLQGANFQDRERLYQVVKKHSIQLESQIQAQALKYAVNLSASGLNSPSLVANYWYGLKYLHFIRQLIQEWPTQVDSLIEQLSYWQKALLHAPADMVLSCDKSAYDTLKKASFFSPIPQAHPQSLPPFSHYAPAPVTSQIRLIASSVAFTAQVIPTVPYTHSDAPALNVASFLFNTLTLHPLIREEGGAYGGGAVNNALAGNLYFYAYRDPHISSSISAFQKAIQTVVEGDFEQRQLDEARLELLQDLDAPVAPGSRAILAYSWEREKKTQEARQAFRDQLLGLSKKALITAVATHIAPKISLSAVVSFAGEALIHQEKERLSLPVYRIDDSSP